MARIENLRELLLAIIFRDDLPPKLVNYGSPERSHRAGEPAFASEPRGIRDIEQFACARHTSCAATGTSKSKYMEGYGARPVRAPACAAGSV